MKRFVQVGAKWACWLTTLCAALFILWSVVWIGFYRYVLHHLPLTPPCTAAKLSELEPIFNQPFTFFDYTAPGDQHGALDLFISEDGRYVIKIFLPRDPHLTSYQRLPLIRTLTAYRKQLKEQKRRYYGCVTAYSLMPKACGLLYYHLAPSPGLFNRTVTLIDKEGAKRALDLDQDNYILQRKAVVASAYLKECMAQERLDKAKRGVADLLAFILCFQRQGVMIPDLMVHRNFGFIDEKVIRLDVEYLCFRAKPNKRDERHMKSHLALFRAWLNAHTSHEVVDFFDREVQRMGITLVGKKAVANPSFLLQDLIKSST